MLILNLEFLFPSGFLRHSWPEAVLIEGLSTAYRERNARGSHD